MERSGRNWAPTGLFLDPPAAIRNNVGQTRDSTFPSGNRPPWQSDRNDFGSNQNARPESPPWSRNMRPDNKIKDFQEWYNRRPGMDNYNDHNKSAGPGGWEKQPPRNNQGGENNSPWRADDPVLMERRGGRDDPWNSRPLSDRGDWTPMGADRSETGFRSYGPSEVNQMDRFGRPPSNTWSGESPTRQGGPRDPDWKDLARYPNFRERPQEPSWYGGSKGPLLGQMEEHRYRHGSAWDGPRDRLKQEEWNQRLTDVWMKNHPDNLSSNQSRDFDNQRWMNRLEPVTESDHYNYVDEPIQQGDRNDFYEWDDRRPGGAQGMPDRDFGRKRGRFPEQDVWSRLDSHDMNDLPLMKKPRMDDHPKSLLSDDVMAAIQQERMNYDIHPNSNPAFDISSPNVDLRQKLGRQDPPQLSRELKSIKVAICPRFKKSKFRVTDLDAIRDKLTKDLYDMAHADNIESQPQLRFENWVAGRSGICVTCYDVASAKWLLNWDCGKTRVPVRHILPDDSRQLAIIGFDIKGNCDLNSENVKNILKIQNPGLDTTLWVDVSKRVSKKGKVYVYQVDGHSLRALTAKKWELFFDMQKVFIRRFRTNFVFDPLEFELFQ